MIKFTVLYPYKEGTRFDFDYYRDRHIAKVREALLPIGLVDTTIEKGVDGGAYGKPPPYHCIAALIFNNRAEMKSAFERADQQVMADLLADIPNYTEVEPIMMITEAVA